MGPGLSAQLPNRTRRRLGVLRCSRNTDDVRPLGGELERDGPPDAPSGTGYDGDLILKLIHNPDQLSGLKCEVSSVGCEGLPSETLPAGRSGAVSPGPEAMPTASKATARRP